MSNETECNVKEAAARLGWAGTTLRDKVSAQTVPHHRRHLVKGIFFTDDDLAEIQARQLRRPGRDLRAGPQPLSDQQDRTGEDAEIDGPFRCLSGAADTFDKAAVAVIQAIASTDPTTHHAISLSYQTCDLPHLDQLDPLFAVAALAIAVNNLNHSDALNLTIDLWGGRQSRLPKHLQYDLATTEETSTEMATGKQVGPHLAYYESVQGLPLIVGPFPDYNTAWRHIDGPNVDEDLYDRAWVQPITAPDAGALYPGAKQSGQCQASGCDLPGTTRYEREKAVTVPCDECIEEDHVGFGSV